VYGVSGRQMLGALIAGQRDPKALAHLARASMRAKIPQLHEALAGHFDDHHGFLCQLMLEGIDAATTKINQVTAQIDRVIGPVCRPRPTVGCHRRGRGGRRPRADRRLRRRDGPLPHRRAPGLLGQVRPQPRPSAGKSKAATTGKGNPSLAATLGEVASSTSPIPDSASSSCSWQLPGQPPSHHGRSPVDRGHRQGVGVALGVVHDLLVGPGPGSLHPGVASPYRLARRWRPSRSGVAEGRPGW
jgi:hypothetical protein